jgi:uncharacterized membrane protein YbhN (UPF0104 family)
VLDRIGRASLGWLVVAGLFELASCLGYVAVVRLVLYRGPGEQVRNLAWSELAFGALVPLGGAGGLAVGAWAMRAWGAPWGRVANRSAVIFLLTSAVNALVLGVTGFGIWLGIGSGRTGVLYGLVPAVFAFGALGAFLLLPRIGPPAHGDEHHWRHRLRASLHATGTWVRDTESVAFSGNWRALGAVAYLVLDIAALWACLRAMGVHPRLLALAAGYQIGYLANLIPIPGGIGVLDGGLVAALALYGLPVGQAADAVILYHAILLWVVTIGGTIGFIRLRRSLAPLDLQPEPGTGAPGTPAPEPS